MKHTIIALVAALLTVPTLALAADGGGGSGGGQYTNDDGSFDYGSYERDAYNSCCNNGGFDPNYGNNGQFNDNGGNDPDHYDHDGNPL